MLVTGHVRKKWLKLSLVTVSRSTILQKEHRGETFASNAFNLLFRGRELFLSKKRKFLRSLGRYVLFHNPIHLPSSCGSGVGTETSTE